MQGGHGQRNNCWDQRTPKKQGCRWNFPGKKNIFWKYSGQRRRVALNNCTSRNHKERNNFWRFSSRRWIYKDSCKTMFFMRRPRKVFPCCLRSYKSDSMEMWWGMMMYLLPLLCIALLPAPAVLPPSPLMTWILGPRGPSPSPTTGKGKGRRQETRASIVSYFFSHPLFFSLESGWFT